MADFTLWGTITQVAPNEFVATAALGPSDGVGRAKVDQAVLESREQAVAFLHAATVKLGATAVGMGGRVVDTVVED